MASSITTIDVATDVYWIPNDSYSPQHLELLRDQFKSKGKELQFDVIEREGKWGYLVTGHDQGESGDSARVPALPTPSSIPKKRRTRFFGSNRSSRLILNAPLSWLSNTSDRVRPLSNLSESSDRVRFKLGGDHTSFTRSSNGSFDWRSSLYFVGLRSSKASDEIHNFLPASQQDWEYDPRHREVSSGDQYDSRFQLPVTQFDPATHRSTYSLEDQESPIIPDFKPILSTELNPGNDTGADSDDVTEHLPADQNSEVEHTDDKEQEQEERQGDGDASPQAEAAAEYAVEEPNQKSSSEAWINEGPGKQVDLLETGNRRSSSFADMADETALDEQASDAIPEAPPRQRYTPFELPLDASGFLLFATAMRKYSVYVDPQYWTLWVLSDEGRGKEEKLIKPEDKPLLIFKALEERQCNPILALSFRSSTDWAMTLKLNLQFEVNRCLISLGEDVDVSLDPHKIKSFQNAPAEPAQAPAPTPPPTLSPPAKQSDDPKVEIFKSFRVGTDDPCWRVLPAALRKYNIKADWREYGLYIVYGDEERHVGLEEKPLVLFKELDREGKRPMFMLRKIANPLPTVDELTNEIPDSTSDESQQLDTVQKPNLKLSSVLGAAHRTNPALESARQRELAANGFF